MAKRTKSQWDFGELFPPEATRKVLSVSELTLTIRRLLEKEVGEVWVSGEITNLRLQSSGHIYFTLKDEGCQLSCVLFRGETGIQRQFLKDGQKVLVHGEVTVYEPRGQYQLRVTAVELQGVGALQLKFEQLKQKLQTEGLFAQERKRPLPSYPRCIGVVTSPTGAAIRDVVHVIQRRDPSLEVILAPCRVQGLGAAEEIAAAIQLLNWTNDRLRSGGQMPGLGQGMDLILLTRGGGSLEDLWAFNEEAVARAVFESALPVVSAVGHEIDFTIGDFVADLRAATPSAAAEIITQGVFGAREFVADAGERLRELARQGLDTAIEDFDALVLRLGRVHPKRVLDERLQRLDDLQGSMARGLGFRWRECQINAVNLAQRLHRLHPGAEIQRRRDRVVDVSRRLGESTRRRCLDTGQRLETLQTRLRLLSPEQVLARGYSITMDASTGRVLRNAAEACGGQKLQTRLKAGEVRSVVERTD